MFNGMAVAQKDLFLRVFPNPLKQMLCERVRSASGNSRLSQLGSTLSLSHPDFDSSVKKCDRKSSVLNVSLKSTVSIVNKAVCQFLLGMTLLSAAV